MTIMEHRMNTEPNLWDQAGYNLELWFPSRDAHLTSGASIRVMDPLCFVNSKVMTRVIRHSPALRKEKHVPVAMHANYHTDKANKMKNAAAYYAPGGTLRAFEPCLVGCGKDPKTVAELERKHRHAVNDGVASSKKWTAGAAGAWGEHVTEGDQTGGTRARVSLSFERLAARGSDDVAHCAPAKPWGGAVGKEARSIHWFPYDRVRVVNAVS